MQNFGFILCCLGVVLILVGFGIGAVQIGPITTGQRQADGRGPSPIAAIIFGVVTLIAGGFVLSRGNSDDSRNQAQFSRATQSDGASTTAPPSEVIEKASGSGQQGRTEIRSSGIWLNVYGVSQDNTYSGFIFKVNPAHAIHIEANFQCSDNLTCGVRSLDVPADANPEDSKYHFIVKEPDADNIHFTWSVDVYN